MVHTEHLGVRGDGEGVDVGQVALVLDQTSSRDHQDMCRLGNISLHGYTHTVLHITHISHWRTEVYSTIRILVLVHTQHFRCVELVEDADQRTTVPVVSHTTSIVTLTSQILQSCKLHLLHTVQYIQYIQYTTYMNLYNMYTHAFH